MVGALLVVLSSTAWGIVIARKLSLRVRFLQQFLQFLSYIETEILYAHRVLSEIIRSYQNEGELQTFLTFVCSELDNKKSFGKAWRDAVENLPSSYGLLRQDKELICAFGGELGASDIEGQMALCQLNKGLVSAALQEAQEEKLEKSKLYFMLGSSAGACLAIMLL